MTRKIYVEDDNIETDVRFCVNGSDPIDRLEVPEVVLILFHCRVIFSTAVVSELYLWHAHWLVFVQFLDGQHSQVLWVIRFESQEDVGQRGPQ